MRRAHCQLWQLMEDISCCGAAWLAQVVETFLKWKLLSLSVDFWQECSRVGHKVGAEPGLDFAIWHIQRTVPNTEVPHSGIVIPILLRSLRMYGLIWSWLSLLRSPETWGNWRCLVYRNGPKYHLPDFSDLSMRGMYRLLMQSKVAPLDIIWLMTLGCPNSSTCLLVFLLDQ